jgi:hypothetical protein
VAFDVALRPVEVDFSATGVLPDPKSWPLDVYGGTLERSGTES